MLFRYNPTIHLIKSATIIIFFNEWMNDQMNENTNRKKNLKKI